MDNITENAHFFVWIKTIITGISTGFTVAFGWLGWMLLAWIACMALDYITGSVAAAKTGAGGKGDL